MFDIDISEASRKIHEILTNLDTTVLDGMILAGDMLRQELISRAPNDEFASSVELYYAPNEVIVGPSVKWAVPYVKGWRTHIASTRCPWWRYLRPTIRREFKGSDLLRTIVTEKFEHIKQIIRYRIYEWLGDVLR